MGEDQQQLVTIAGVYELEQSESGSFVLLRDQQNRAFVIGVGPCEAFAILSALNNQKFHRPLSHDLMQAVLEQLGARIEKIVVDDLSNDVFYCRLTISSNGNQLTIDARPSDAIALALRSGAPIYATEAVITEALLKEGD